MAGSVGSAALDLAGAIGSVIQQTRRETRWTQRDLAGRVGVSQSAIARLESGRLTMLDPALVSAVFRVLGIRVVLDNASLGLAGRREQRDAVHAICCAYIGRRLRVDGWLTASEVEIGSGRTRGWIDIVAFRPSDRALLVIEVKTEIRDVGTIQRTVSWYLRSAWSAARSLGWRPAHVSAVLLLLDSAENDARIRANEALLAESFPGRATAVMAMIRGAGQAISGLALVDPKSRRTDWCRSSRAEGRRSPAAYADYRDAAAALGSIGSRRR